MSAKFSLGRVVATPTALAVLNAFPQLNIAVLLDKHARGDFGHLGVEDIMIQDLALEREKTDPDAAERMLSVWYLDGNPENDQRGNKIYIITEADRSSTTILLPEEY